jgi:hypothetical protein
MTAPSAWPSNIKLVLALLAVAALFLPYAALCLGLAQLVYLLE